MSLRSLPLLCLTAINLAAEIPSVQYWTDEARPGWLAAACQVEGASRLTLVSPDGASGQDFITTQLSRNDPQWLYATDYQILPTSGWWHDYVGMHFAQEDAFTNPPTHQWQRDHNRAFFQANALNWIDHLPRTLECTLLAESTPFPTEDPLVEAYGLHFHLPEAAGLSEPLHQAFRTIHRTHDKAMRDYENDNDFQNWRAEIVHELRLLSWTPTHCAALTITKSRRQFTSTSIDLKSLHLRRNAAGDWTPYDPLKGQIDRQQLLETIRQQLNAQEASGDYFAERFPDPLSPEAQELYTPLRIGSRLYLLFPPYVVASGAQGTITISPATYAEQP